jgi:hypothetical protein
MEFTNCSSLEVYSFIGINLRSSTAEEAIVFNLETLAKIIISSIDLSSDNLKRTSFLYSSNSSIQIIVSKFKQIKSDIFIKVLLYKNYFNLEEALIEKCLIKNIIFSLFGTGKKLSIKGLSFLEVNQYFSPGSSNSETIDQEPYTMKIIGTEGSYLTDVLLDRVIMQQSIIQLYFDNIEGCVNLSRISVYDCLLLGRTLIIFHNTKKVLVTEVNFENVGSSGCLGFLADLKSQASSISIENSSFKSC